MDKRLKKWWIENLRSGKFQQATGELHKTVGTGRARSKRSGYCCLGVLSCRVTKLKAVKETGWTWTGAVWVHSDVGHEAQVIPRAVSNAIDLDFSVQGELAEMNDEGKRSFKQIAKWIEKYVL